MALKELIAELELGFPVFHTFGHVLDPESFPETSKWRVSKDIWQDTPEDIFQESIIIERTFPCPQELNNVYTGNLQETDGLILFEDEPLDIDDEEYIHSIQKLVVDELKDRLSDVNDLEIIAVSGPKRVILSCNNWFTPEGIEYYAEKDDLGFVKIILYNS